MNKTCLIIYVFALTSMARAGLIDLTPGGTPDDFGPPTPVQIHGFYDQAVKNFPNVPDGWVSQYGILNGGQYFLTDLFTQPASPTANVSWNFGNSGYWMKYIDVFGFDQATGADLANLYQVPYGFRLTGSDMVTLDGQMTITSIAFYGRNPLLPLPDTGGTLAMLFVGILGLFGIRSRHAFRSHCVRE